MLLTDGTVLIQAASFGSNPGYGTGSWYRLTPDADGNYTDGTWTQVASMPSGYAPLWHATAVLPDGRVLVEGGEYNGSSSQAETSLGAIFDPVANAWTTVNPPYDPLDSSAWSRIGDAQSVVLANGTLMLGNCCSSEQALFNESNLSWTILSNNGKADVNSEEGWVLLPNGDVLTVDMSYEGGTYSQLFNPALDSWSETGSVRKPGRPKLHRDWADGASPGRYCARHRGHRPDSNLQSSWRELDGRPCRRRRLGR